jgi:hypothetical protein
MKIKYEKNKEISMYIYESNRNKRSKSRDSLAKFVNNLSISNMDSIRIQLGMLSMFTNQADELSRYSQVYLLPKFHVFLKTQNKIIYFHKNTIINQCIKLIESLEFFSTTRPVKEVKKSLNGLISIMGSIKSVNTNFKIK